MLVEIRKGRIRGDIIQFNLKVLKFLSFFLIFLPTDLFFFLNPFV